MNHNKKGSILPFLLMDFGCGILLGIMLILLIPELFYQTLLFPELAFGCMFLLNMIFQPFLHELGHYVFGKISGYRLISFRIGPFILLKQSKGTRMIIQKRFAGIGGQCLMCPPEGKGINYPFKLYHYGGLIFNAVILFVGAVLFFSLPAYPVAQTFALVTFSFSLYTILLNGIPLASGNMKNDAYNVKMMESDPVFRKAIDTQLRVKGALCDGKRLRDLPIGIFDLPPENSLSDPQIAQSLLFRAEYFIDRGEYQDACDIYSFISERKDMPPFMRILADGELVFLELVVGAADPQYVAQHFSKQTEMYLRQSSGNDLSSARILFAYEMLFCHMPQAAEAYWRQFDQASAKMIYPGVVAVEKEQMALAQQRICKEEQTKNENTPPDSPETI